MTNLQRKTKKKEPNQLGQVDTRIHFIISFIHLFNLTVNI